MDVANMSDDQLRSKLVEFGLPNYPITDSTRELLRNKLVHLLNNVDTTDSTEVFRRSLGNYSSGEESEIDVNVKSKRPSGIKVQSPVKVVTANNFDNHTASDRSQQIRSRASLTASQSYSRPFYSSSFSTTALTNNTAISGGGAAAAAAAECSTYKTPFLSNFTQRLSQLKDNAKQSTTSNRDAGRTKSDGMRNQSILSRFTTSPRAKEVVYRTVLDKSTSATDSGNHSNFFKKNYISFIVLFVAVVFFVFLGIVYSSITSDTNLETTAVVPYCTEDNLTTTSSSKMPKNCILETDKINTFALMKIILPELQQRAVENYCNDKSVKPYLSNLDIVTFIRSHYQIQEDNIIRDLSNLKVLILFNQFWPLKVVNITSAPNVISSDLFVKSLDKLEVDHGATGIAIVVGKYPWSCLLFKQLSNVLYVVVVVGISVVCMLTILKVVKYLLWVKQRQQEEEQQLLNNIIDIVKTNTAATANNSSPSMIVNHVRDMVIPINERKKKEKLWKRAVKTINDNESRIRMDVQKMHGEVVEVWHWVGGNSSNITRKTASADDRIVDGNTSSGSVKLQHNEWQGQAFETQMGAVNSLPCSPTACLKVRGIVEDGDRNSFNSIQSAVLTKCGPSCRILHCAVDWKSKCVYLKCAGTEDAAFVYNNLHGWWYSGTLVTVKYLRLERYLQRFPNSPVNGPYLKCDTTHVQ